MPIPELITLATAILAWSVVSRTLATSPLTPTLLFMLCGLVVGPSGFGWAGFGLGRDTLLHLAELTLLLVLFSDAARIDFSRLHRDSGPALRLLLLALPLAFVLGTALAAVLFPAWSWYEAALLAAILAPTDPALAQAILLERRIPAGVRQPINVESGLNDGLCLPLVLFLIWLLGPGAGTANGAPGWLQWFAQDVLVGPVVGLAVALLAGRVVDSAVHAERITGDFRRLATLAIALLAFALAEAVGGNGLLAAFAAGATTARVAPELRRTVHAFGATEGELLSLLTFLAFGATLLTTEASSATLPGLGYAVLSLALVRPLAVALALLGSGFRWRSVLVLGWFGPRGLASLLFTLLAMRSLGDLPGALAGTALLTVALSVCAHGMTGGPLARAYAQRAKSRHHYRRESHAAAAHPVRHHRGSHEAP